MIRLTYFELYDVENICSELKGHTSKLFVKWRSRSHVCLIDRERWTLERSVPQVQVGFFFNYLFFGYKDRKC